MIMSEKLTFTAQRIHIWIAPLPEWDVCHLVHFQNFTCFIEGIQFIRNKVVQYLPYIQRHFYLFSIFVLNFRQVHFTFWWNVKKKKKKMPDEWQSRPRLDTTCMASNLGLHYLLRHVHLTSQYFWENMINLKNKKRVGYGETMIFLNKNSKSPNQSSQYLYCYNSNCPKILNTLFHTFLT